MVGKVVDFVFFLRVVSVVFLMQIMRFAGEKALFFLRKIN